MDGLQYFIFMSIGVALFLVIIFVLLRKYNVSNYFRIMFVGVLLISIAIIIFSFFVGGWAGIGYGFMGFSILIGTVVASVVIALIRYFGND